MVRRRSSTAASVIWEGVEVEPGRCGRGHWLGPFVKPVERSLLASCSNQSGYSRLSRFSRYDDFGCGCGHGGSGERPGKVRYVAGYCIHRGSSGVTILGVWAGLARPALLATGLLPGEVSPSHPPSAIRESP